MPEDPSPAETIAAARAHFLDALAYLDASGIAVDLHPHDGTWGYVVQDKRATEGGIVAMVALMRPVETCSPYSASVAAQPLRIDLT